MNLIWNCYSFVKSGQRFNDPEGEGQLKVKFHPSSANTFKFG